MALTIDEYRERELLSKLTISIWKDDINAINQIIKSDKTAIQTHSLSIKDINTTNTPTKIEIPTTGLGVMHLSAFADSLSVFILFLSQGIPIGQLSINGDDPLLYAVYNNSLEVFSFILSHDENQIKKLRSFSLVRASLRTGNNKLTHRLITAGAPIDPMAVSDAIMRNNAEILIEFIERTNYNPNIFGSLSPVQFACLNGETQILQFLLTKGYQYIYPNDKGLTAFHIACYLKNLDCAEVLLNFLNFKSPFQGKYQAIHSAVMTLNPEFVTKVIELGAKVDALDADGFPAAHLIFQNHKEVDKVISIYEILYSYGYDFNMKPESSKCCWPLLPTVLVSATRNPIIIAWLIDHDCWINETIILANGKVLSVKDTLEKTSKTNQRIREALERYKSRNFR